MKLVRKTMPFLVMAMLFAVPAFSQTGNLSGKVVDESGKPVTGATIAIELLRQAGIGTLLFDLLTPAEEEAEAYTRHLRFDISV